MTNVSRNRPLSPHLTVWRPTITYVMSIVHRITGVALYAGTLLVAAWLIAAASGPESFERVNALFGSLIGRLVLLGYTWALMHHMLGGLRHLVWDTGRGLGKYESRKFGWATIAGSVTLTILIWIAGFALRS
ncbi:succinate dehydrogenase subunit C [Hoeflea marina]|uniref:Succinate dehydrogenase cytochrome b556 subunit n=1 Tax=Hoeflea marina TaxID=274592 RepID=A0A317PF35_9HYPH|nr:succinate dehydrogenase, cytochrome b556 subunit [Hoeflea marina]PWV98318.1 succinate dehydrogenase subunit C [Hoeflea marina]